MDSVSVEGQEGSQHGLPCGSSKVMRLTYIGHQESLGDLRLNLQFSFLKTGWVLGVGKVKEPPKVNFGL